MSSQGVVMAKRPRKPSSEWRKTPRLKAVKDLEPDFIGKMELAHHLQCHVSTIDEWVADGTIPPPHSRPGVKHPIWLRRHYKVFRDTGEWPKDSWAWRRDD
jgi:hypothetical protein